MLLKGQITAGLGRLLVAVAAMAAIAGTGGPACAGDWPQWRGGAQRSGAVAEASVLTDLAAGMTLKEAWRSEPLPSGYGEQPDQIVGQGSPVIWAGKVYLYINWPDTNSIPAGRFKFPKRVNDTVLCLDLATGRTIWKTSVPGVSWRWGCSATPAVSGGRLVSIGSDGRMFCLDAETGRELWCRPDRSGVGEDAGYNNVIGPLQSSPLIHEGVAFFSVADYEGLVALDLTNGVPRWSAPKPVKGQAPSAWSSPCVWRHDGGWTVLGRNCGFDFATGAARWRGMEHGWGTPAVEGDSCAVMGGKGVRIYKLTAKGPQLVAETEIDNSAGNPAVSGGRVYACGARKVAPARLPDPLENDSETGVSEPTAGNAAKAVQPTSRGVLLCMDAATGKVLWETVGEDLQLGGGQWSYISPMVGSGIVCVLSNRLLLFSAADGKRLGSPTLQIPTHKCTSLAMAGDSLVARGRRAVVCYKTEKTQ